MALQPFSAEARAFLEAHKNDDPATLMLQAKRFPGLPVAELVQQIQARQKAKNKLPHWAENFDLIFPANLSVEQASSELTAQYKASLISGEILVDLTGGFGVDVFYFSQQFRQVYHVEQNEALSETVAFNFEKLDVNNVTFQAQNATVFLENFSEIADCIYLDPARRGTANQKVHLLEDCEPDVLQMLPTLLAKSHSVLLKTSPMLDIDRAVQQLKNVEKIWVIAVENECKEVLYQIGQTENPDPEITAVNLTPKAENAGFSFRKSNEETAETHYSEPLEFIYEPNAAIMKAGAFRQIAQRFGLKKLHRNSHLYTSVDLVADFPGRSFRLKTVAKYNKKVLHGLIPEKKANITVRNFPETVAQIRQKTGLKEGGDLYLFATTDMHQQLVILVCEKAV
ncbi:THUMP-like domain-containing protein [Adhaeribacter terreus]|uniref:THUMP-like domain-containing protein n=1 Tax=Adhaeribacter terreus TaxID=529703 RepID=A0ABW0E655_9BACT